MVHALSDILVCKALAGSSNTKKQRFLASRSLRKDLESLLENSIGEKTAKLKRRKFTVKRLCTLNLLNEPMGART